MPDIEQRELYLVGTDLMHGKTGATDMRTFTEEDLQDYSDQYIGTEIAELQTYVINNNQYALARTVTTDGLTTGSMDVGLSGITTNQVVVTVTSDDANKILTLPTSPIGKIVRILPSGTGYEIRTSDPATIGINGGTGAGAESAIASGVYVELMGVSATNWIGRQYTSAGVVSAVQVAAA